MPQSQGSPAAAPAQAQTTTSIPGLQAQLGELNIQAMALRATHEGLVRQLNGMRLDNPARAALQHQSADVGATLAQVEGKIAETQARLIQAGVPVEQIGGTSTEAPPPPPSGFIRSADPDMIVGMSFVLAMCLVLPVSIAFARRVWRGKPQQQQAPDRLDEVVQRLGRLELGMDSIAIEIERVTEGQRFVTKIMADRPAQVVQAEGPQQSALSEGQPPLRALGAGPAEPIQVKVGEAVKQRVQR